LKRQKITAKWFYCFDKKQQLDENWHLFGEVASTIIIITNLQFFKSKRNWDDN
jgi:hypothetical protein